jgi:hypothetical protein
MEHNIKPVGKKQKKTGPPAEANDPVFKLISN